MEVLAAFLILTLVITVSMMAFLERNKRLQQANELILVYQCLSNEAELRRRQDFDSFKPGLRKKFISSTALLAPLEPFETAVEVADVKPGIKNVTLRVSWRGGKREAKLDLIRTQTGGTNLW